MFVLELFKQISERISTSKKYIQWDANKTVRLLFCVCRSSCPNSDYYILH